MHYEYEAIFSFLLLAILGPNVCHTESHGVTLIPPRTEIKKITGETYFVSCSPSTPSGNSVRVEWMNPKWQRIRAERMARINVYHGFGHALFFKKLSPEDSGTYTCLTHSGNATIRLVVEDRIEIDAGLATQEASEGVKTFTMKCPAVRVQSPWVSWKLDGVDIPGRRQGSRYQVTDEGHLRILNVTLVDGQKVYTCRTEYVELTPPTSRENNVKLIVKAKPEIKILPNPTQTPTVVSSMIILHDTYESFFGKLVGWAKDYLLTL